MSEVRTTTPTAATTWNPIWPWQYGGKKWTVTCGECENTWRPKVPVSTYQSAICPVCGFLNKWRVTVGKNDD